MLNKYVIWLKNIKICFICLWEPSKQRDQAWMGGREKIGEAKLHCAFAKAKALNPRPPVAVLSFPATSSLAPRSSERAFNSLLRPGLGLAGGDSAGTATLHLGSV